MDRFFISQDIRIFYWTVNEYDEKEMWRNIRWKEIFDGSRLSFRGSIYLNDNYSYLRKFPLHWHLSPIFKKLFLPLESIPPRDIPWYPVYTRSIIYKRVYISKKKSEREKEKNEARSFKAFSSCDKQRPKWDAKTKIFH